LLSQGEVPKMPEKKKAVARNSMIIRHGFFPVIELVDKII
jgi:hypothetical protein